MDFFKAAPGSDTKSRLSIELSSKPHSENTDRQVLKTYGKRLAYHGYEFSDTESETGSNNVNDVSKGMEMMSKTLANQGYYINNIK